MTKGSKLTVADLILAVGRILGKTPGEIVDQMSLAQCKSVFEENERARERDAKDFGLRI